MIQSLHYVMGGRLKLCLGLKGVDTKEILPKASLGRSPSRADVGICPAHRCNSRCIYRKPDRLDVHSAHINFESLIVAI